MMENHEEDHLPLSSSTFKEVFDHARMAFGTCSTTLRKKYVRHTDGKPDEILAYIQIPAVYLMPRACKHDEYHPPTFVIHDLESTIFEIFAGKCLKSEEHLLDKSFRRQFREHNGRNAYCFFDCSTELNKKEQIHNSLPT